MLQALSGKRYAQILRMVFKNQNCVFEWNVSNETLMIRAIINAAGFKR